MKEVVEKHQHVPVADWFFTGVVFRSITVVNLKSSSVPGLFPYFVSPAFREEEKMISVTINAGMDLFLINSYRKVG